MRLANEEDARWLEGMKDAIEQKRHQFDLAFEEKRKKLTQGDELPPGVLKMVKVYLAVKRRLQPGQAWHLVALAYLPLVIAAYLLGAGRKEPVS